MTIREREKQQKEARLAKIKHEREQCITTEDIVAHAEKYASWEVSTEDKMLLAESMIPKGAKRLYAEDFKDYAGVFIGGWLGDSQYKKYGFCDGTNKNDNTLRIHGYSFYVAWKPTLQEMIGLMAGTTLVEKLGYQENQERVQHEHK